MLWADFKSGRLTSKEDGVQVGLPGERAGAGTSHFHSPTLPQPCLELLLSVWKRNLDRARSLSSEGGAGDLKAQGTVGHPWCRRHQHASGWLHGRATLPNLGYSNRVLLPESWWSTLLGLGAITH